jgi:AAA domain
MMDTTPLRVLSASALAHEVSPSQPVLDPILPVGGQALLYGAAGVGKSFLALGMAYAAATGGSFLGWRAARRHQVVYVDGEMGPAELHRRLALFGPPPRTLEFALVSLDRGPALDLAHGASQMRLMENWGYPDLVVLDNLSSLTGLRTSEDRWRDLQRFIVRQRRQARAMLLVHHANREGRPRGISRREDVLDLVLALRRPADWQPSDGARFEIHVEKSRSLHGPSVEPIVAHLQGAQWQWNAVRTATLDRGVALLKDGLSAEAVGRALGISRASAFRLQRKARQHGLIGRDGSPT